MITSLAIKRQVGKGTEKYSKVARVYIQDVDLQDGQNEEGYKLWNKKFCTINSVESNPVHNLVEANPLEGNSVDESNLVEDNSTYMSYLLPMVPAAVPSKQSPRDADSHGDDKQGMERDWMEFFHLSEWVSLYPWVTCSRPRRSRSHDQVDTLHMWKSYNSSRLWLGLSHQWPWCSFDYKRLRPTVLKARCNEHTFFIFVTWPTISYRSCDARENASGIFPQCSVTRSCHRVLWSLFSNTQQTVCLLENRKLTHWCWVAHVWCESNSMAAL